MKSFTSLLKLLILPVVAICATLPASGAIDSKFYRKISDRVWERNVPVLEIAAAVPDSVSDNVSAIILEWTDDIKVDHEVQNTLNTVSGYTNRIRKNWLSHRIVKLLDQSAIDYYSDFEFGEKKQVKIMERLLLYDLNTAFGARVHKPDGRIIEVDLSEAIEVGQGKKGKKDRTYKIAIPGLEPGDILEYFRYTDEMADHMSLNPQNLLLCDKYPVLSRHINLTTDPGITVEYKCYNGVPDLARSTEGNKQTAKLALNDVPGVNFSKYVMSYRQLPFIRVQFLNNNEKDYLSGNSRRGGLYGNILPGKIISELRDYISGVKYNDALAGKANKYVNDYFLKANPDATAKQTADAAWLALKYLDLTAKSSDSKTSGQFERALVFTDMLRKLKLYTDEQIGIGIINPRTDVPTKELSAWDESRFVVRTPDALYFIPLDNAIAPGELPAAYYGENAMLYTGDRKTWTNRTLVDEYTLPHKRASENSCTFRDTVTLLDDDKVAVSSSMKIVGAAKSMYADVTSDTEWAAEAEDFFGIPANKRFRDKSYDPDGRAAEIRDMISEYGENFYGTTPEKVLKASVSSRGTRPDAPELTVCAEVEFDGVVERLGDDISLTVGALTGMPERLPDNERNRLLDVMYPCISQEIHSMLIKAPAGYKFDEASVNALNRNANDITMQFNVNARLNDDGDIEMNTLLRYKQADVPLALWPRMLEVLDQAAAFSNASVILTPQ